MTVKPKSLYSAKEFDKALWIAAHFGFTPIDAPRIKDEDIDLTKDCAEAHMSDVVCDPSEKAAFIRTYLERGLSTEPHPLALAWKRANAKKTYDYSLELVGFPPGIAEAKLIRTALSIIMDTGQTNLTVEVNSIGDKESIAAYERELVNHIRKLITPLSPESKQKIKEDIFNILKAEEEEIKALRAHLPSSIASLSSASRNYFKEVLEYVEALGIEFRLAPELIGNKHFCSETLFAVRDASKNTLLALGYRYSRLSKRFGFKKELPLVGVTIYGEEVAKKTYKDLPHPKFYLVHLGREARMKSLPLIELLRINRIPLYHYLGKEKITAQLETAERVRAPYLIIVGQKEAIDNTVTIRNVTTRAQDTISVSVLPDYLKHIPF